jgi:hypothetical protein
VSDLDRALLWLVAGFASQFLLFLYAYLREYNAHQKSIKLWEDSLEGWRETIEFFQEYLEKEMTRESD